MKDEKRKKIAVALTVNMVLLVFILVAVIISQIIQIVVLNNRKQALYTEYCTLLAMLDENEELYDRLETDEQFFVFFCNYVNLYGNEDPYGIIPDGVTIDK